MAEQSGAEQGEAGARPRFQRPERRQIEWRPWSLDQLLPDPHSARAVWDYVDGLDLSAFYADIRAVEGAAGRSPIDPRILLSLWLLATLDGVGAARRLSRLCEQHLAYLWLCGGVSVNYHTLSDFRTQAGSQLDELLTQSVAVLLHEGLVNLHRVAQDGMRVRAERVQRALEARVDVARRKEQHQKGTGPQARASTTDPDARIMKMADGGFRPAYNVQFATTTDTRVIVGVDVIRAGTDGGQLGPLLEQGVSRYGQRPQDYLADGGFNKLDDIRQLEAGQTQVYLPVRELEQKRAKGIDPYAALKGDPPEVARWRERMGTAAAQAIYRERAASAELANAGCRNRGLTQFMVRGLAKVKAVALWQALAHNLQRTLSLRSLGRAVAG